MDHSRPGITLLITSCDRHDLLARTLESFTTFDTSGLVSEIIVVEDGMTQPVELCRRYRARLVSTGGRVGQSRAIDLGYSLVRTAYVFHCEDDWEFYRAGFIEKSLDVLRVDLACMNVWLRAWDDTNGHPFRFKSDCRTHGILETGYLGVWHGFAWNPGLRRTGDMRKFLPLTEVYDKPGAHGEVLMNKRFFEAGYHAVVLDEGGYVRHLGTGRHVE